MASNCHHQHLCVRLWESWNKDKGEKINIKRNFTCSQANVLQWDDIRVATADASIKPTSRSTCLSVCVRGKLFFFSKRARSKAARFASFGRLLVVTDTQRATFQRTGGGCSDISRAQCPLPYAILSEHLHMEGSRACTDSHTRTHTHTHFILITFYKKVSTCLRLTL